MILLRTSGNETLTVISFIIYCFYRSFLYPCLFGALASSFGFRFYGALSGITVSISGVVFLLMVPLISNFAIGSCHASSEDECSTGNWNYIHMVQIISFVLLVPMEIVYPETIMPPLQLKVKLRGEEEAYIYGSVGGAELVDIKPIA